MIDSNHMSIEMQIQNLSILDGSFAHGTLFYVAALDQHTLTGRVVCKRGGKQAKQLEFGVKICCHCGERFYLGGEIKES